MRTHPNLLSWAAPAALAVVFAVGQSASAQLLHLWDFNAGDELADSAGSLDLIAAPGEGGITTDDGGTPDDTSDDTVLMGTAGDIVFEPGFGGIGQAYRPYYVDSTVSSTAGAGLTGSGFTSPGQFTIETIVKADIKDSGSAVNYIFQTRPGSDRGYYLVQAADTSGRAPVGQLGSIVGNNFGDSELPATHDDGGHWFYLAAAIDLTTNPGQAVADIWAADLTAGDLVPTLVADDRTWGTADPSTLAGATGIFGIGNFAIDRDGDTVAEASQEWFQGAIDYVAVYNGLLDGGALAGNLSGRMVPEPTSLGLAGLCLGVLAARRRR